jgi:hypothetical protein
MTKGHMKPRRSGNREPQVSTPRAPDIRVDVYLDTIGYETHIYFGNEEQVVECRDFGVDHPIVALRDDLGKALWETLQEWRKKL